MKSSLSMNFITKALSSTPRMAATLGWLKVARVWASRVTVKMVGEGRIVDFEGDIASEAGGVGAVDFAHVYDTEGRYEPK